MQNAFFVANNSERPILSLVILTVACDPTTGVRRTSRLMLDAFENSGLRPVLRPRQRAFVMPPLTLVPEEEIPRDARQPGPTSETEFRLVRRHGPPRCYRGDRGHRFGHLREPRGAGPDAEHFMDEVPNRRLAAASVAIRTLSISPLAPTPYSSTSSNTTSTRYTGI